jgi:hypothetical protein
MGYRQIDGNKPLLIHENGKVRNGLRNLPPDSDRFVYHYDKSGKPSTKHWPKLIISHDSDGNDDVRLLPEVQMKTHGQLPNSLVCNPDDFKALDGDKTNCALDNLEYVGDGSFKKKSPYKEKKEAPPAEAQPEEEIETSEPEIDEEPEEEIEEAYKTSLLYKATEAVEIIKQGDFEELLDSGFLDEEEDRVTVVEAWGKAEKEYKEFMNG